MIHYGVCVIWRIKERKKTFAIASVAPTEWTIPQLAASEISYQFIQSDKYVESFTNIDQEVVVRSERPEELQNYE